MARAGVPSRAGCTASTGATRPGSGSGEDQAAARAATAAGRQSASSPAPRARRRSPTAPTRASVAAASSGWSLRSAIASATSRVVSPTGAPGAARRPRSGPDGVQRGCRGWRRQVVDGELAGSRSSRGAGRRARRSATGRRSVDAVADRWSLPGATRPRPRPGAPRRGRAVGVFDLGRDEPTYRLHIESGARDSAWAICSSSSINRAEVNEPKRSPRRVTSSATPSIRAATTARQACPVPGTPCARASGTGCRSA